MKVLPFLVGGLAQLAACASFAGKEDDYAAFMAESGRGPLFGNAIRELATAKPGQAVQDTGIGEGKFWRQDPKTGNVEDVSHLVADLNEEHTAELERHQKLWAEEEANSEMPSMSSEDEAKARRMVAEWENPHPKALSRRAATLKVGGKEVTKEQYFAMKAEMDDEFGEIDPSALATRDNNAVAFFEPISLVTALVITSYVYVGAIAVGGAGIAGGIGGGIAGIISLFKKHRKKKRQRKLDKINHPGESKKDRKERHKQEENDRKEARKHEKEDKKQAKKKPPGRLAKRAPPGFTVWKGGDKATPIFSVTEMEKVADAAAAA